MARTKLSLDEILVEGRAYNSHDLRRRLIEESVKKAACERCRNTRWNGDPIPLQLDHINGVRTDNRLENLRILCPNCHVQTETWGRKKTKRPPKQCDCGNVIGRASTRCTTCYNADRSPRKKKIDWPPVDTLFLMVQVDGYRQVGKKLGVTDNAVRGHLKRHAGVV